MSPFKSNGLPAPLKSCDVGYLQDLKVNRELGKACAVDLWPRCFSARMD